MNPPTHRRLEGISSIGITPKECSTDECADPRRVEGNLKYRHQSKGVQDR